MTHFSARKDRVVGVMVRMLASSVVYRGFGLRPDQTIKQTITLVFATYPLSALY